MGGKFHPKLNVHSRLIENKYREGKVKRTLKRELKVPEISGSEADGTGFLRLDCCSQKHIVFGLCKCGGAAVVQCFSLRLPAHCCDGGRLIVAGPLLTGGARRNFASCRGVRSACQVYV